MTPTLFSILLYRYKELHREDEEVIMSLLKEGDVYVDVGANIGTTTLAGALSVGASGKVIAFEAHPRTVKGLQKSIDLNPKLKERTSVRFVAIGQEVGITHISDLAMDDINFLTDKGIEVPLSTLDVELADVKHIDLIKIDVEGYEKQVFEGAKETLKKTKQIYFESFEPNFTRFNYTLDDILEQLAKANFTVYSLKNSKKTQVTRGYRNTEEYENLLAIKN
jgi:FkbM family methyltransferase